MTRLVRTIAVAASVGAAALGAATSAAAVTYTIQDPADGMVIQSVADQTTFGYAIFGSNDGQDGIQTGFAGTAGATEVLTVSGNFLYQTLDIDGSFWDPLILLVGGVETDLAPGLSFAGSAIGTFSFSVLAGQSFSFFIRSLDGAEGIGFASVTGNIQIAAVPLPAAGLMLLAALGALAAGRRPLGRLSARR